MWKGWQKGQLCARDRKLHSQGLTVDFLHIPFDVCTLNAAWTEKFNSFKTFCIKMTCFNVSPSDVEVIFSSPEGGKKKANVFVVKVPKQNFKQMSWWRGSLHVLAAFKSRYLSFFSPAPPSWISEPCKPRRFIAALPNASSEWRVHIFEIPQVLSRERDEGKWWWWAHQRIFQAGFASPSCL